MDDPAHYKRQRELRAGIGVSNPKTGNFQFYGKPCPSTADQPSTDPPGPSSGFCFLQRVYQRIMQSTPNESLLHRRSCSIPDALQKWGIERFMFAADAGPGDPPHASWPAEAFLPRALGDRFIDAYFKIMHPQMPVLVHAEILESWAQMWETPVRGQPIKNKEILFMVLAIGSRVVNLKGKQPEARVEGWAEYFSSRASEGPIFLQEPSVKGMHLMLLKVSLSLLFSQASSA